MNLFYCKAPSNRLGSCKSNQCGVYQRMSGEDERVAKKFLSLWKEQCRCIKKMLTNVFMKRCYHFAVVGSKRRHCGLTLGFVDIPSECSFCLFTAILFSHISMTIVPMQPTLDRL